ncbi:M20/M25/M40 family metallo-hydrolase [Oerskovia sp. M15]
MENAEECTGALEAAARDVLGPASVLLTEQSLGGEDFAWYLTKVPGAMARLGTRSPGGRSYDIHQGDLQVDESAIGAGSVCWPGSRWGDPGTRARQVVSEPWLLDTTRCPTRGPGMATTETPDDASITKRPRYPQVTSAIPGRG